MVLDHVESAVHFDVVDLPEGGYGAPPSSNGCVTCSFAIDDPVAAA
jgi:hypothetical protein